MIEEVKLGAAIVVAAVVKWLMTEQPPPVDEDDAGRRARMRRSVGGIIAGMLLGYFGHEPLIRRFDALEPSDSTIIAIFLVVTGEHVVRWILGFGPETFSKIAHRVFGKGL